MTERVWCLQKTSIGSLSFNAGLRKHEEVVKQASAARCVCPNLAAKLVCREYPSLSRCCVVCHGGVKHQNYPGRSSQRLLHQFVSSITLMSQTRARMALLDLAGEDLVGGARRGSSRGPIKLRQVLVGLRPTFDRHSVRSVTHRYLLVTLRPTSIAILWSMLATSMANFATSVCSTCR